MVIPIIGAMDLASFTASLSGAEPSARLSLAARALWWDAKGDWVKAHDCAQKQDDRDGAWVHAYLHRKEGDAANAAYWYRRSGKPLATGPLAEEAQAIACVLLGASSDED
jgi:hypothetical protein